MIEKNCNKQTSEQSLSSLDDFIKVYYYFGLVKKSIEPLMFTEIDFHPRVVINNGSKI